MALGWGCGGVGACSFKIVKVLLSLFQESVKIEGNLLCIISLARGRSKLPWKLVHMVEEELDLVQSLNASFFPIN